MPQCTNGSTPSHSNWGEALPGLRSVAFGVPPTGLAASDFRDPNHEVPVTDPYRILLLDKGLDALARLQAELELATGMTLTSQSRAMLESGGAVAVFDEYVVDGEIRIDWQDPLEVLMPTSPTGEVPVERSDTLPAVVQKPPAPVQAGILVLPETARELGLDVEPMALMVQLDEAPGFVQSDAVRAISVDRTGSEWGIPTRIETGPTDAVGPSAWALLAVSGGIAITASPVAVGRWRIDGRRDSAILGAVGATPRLRRAIGFWQVLVLAGLGSLVGSVLGVAAAGALALPGGPLPFAPPWMQLLLSTVAVPLAIAIGAGLFPGRQNALPTDRSAIA